MDWGREVGRAMTARGGQGDRGMSGRVGETVWLGLDVTTASYIHSDFLEPSAIGKDDQNGYYGKISRGAVRAAPVALPGGRDAD